VFGHPLNTLPVLATSSQIPKGPSVMNSIEFAECYGKFRINTSLSTFRCDPWTTISVEEDEELV